MCVYGLTVFLECPRDVRKTRTPYIFISFIILILYIIQELSDGYEIFQVLYLARVIPDITKFREQMDHSWWAIVCISAGTSINWIADGLLVSIFSYSIRVNRSL